MRIKPLHDNVLVRRIEAPPTTKGGLYIPDQIREKPIEGRVLAVGPGRRDEKGALVTPGVAVGDVVVFTKHSGHEVAFDGEPALMMTERDILGIRVEA